MCETMLACGPYFDEGGLLGSLALFLLVKPLAYFAFIQAFRYRVSRPIPMRMSQAVWLAAWRAGMGIGFTGLGALTLNALQIRDWLALGWIFLYSERLFSWWLVGRYGARLRGRRLIGWVVSGTAINAAFDVALVWGLIEGWLPQAVIVAIVAVFIAALHVVGRRDSLKWRFSDGAACTGCGYDLTGNLSGRCPECGQATNAMPPAQPQPA
jgi:hypothetical protein